MKISKIHFILALFAALTVSETVQAQTTNAAPKAAEKKSSAKPVSVADAARLLQANPNLVILDVRTPEEFTRGHIAGATNLNFLDDDFETKLGKLDKSKSYLVNCAAGSRSAQACKMMGKQDFKEVYDLKGGLHAWEKAGKPVVK